MKNYMKIDINYMKIGINYMKIVLTQIFVTVFLRYLVD